jgi:putative ABC transport system permease protein
MVVFSSFGTGNHIAVEPKKYYSSIMPKGEWLTESVIDEISRMEGVDRVLPCAFDYTNINTGLGSNFATLILSLKNKDITYMMDLLGLKLVEGKLPAEGTDIVIHKQVATYKKLKVGDFIGREISKEESIQGIYKIVGIIDGKSVMSFARLEQYMAVFHMSYDYIYGGIILPKENSLDIMNASLDVLGPSDYQIDTLNNQLAWQEQYTTKINVLISVISTFIIMIVSSCIGFLCYIYFNQRRNKFGLLWAIGYSRQQVINRAFAEINLINLSGYFFGILFSCLAGLLLDAVYFKPLGDPLCIVNLPAALGAACSPIFVTLFSLIPIWRMLKKLDPITIIEGIN